MFPLGERRSGPGELCHREAGLEGVRPGDGKRRALFLLAGREDQFRLFGVDRDPAAAQVARRQPGPQRPGGEDLDGGWRAAPFAPGSFDLVMSNPPLLWPPGTGGDGGPARMEREEDGLAPPVPGGLPASAQRRAICPVLSTRSGWLTCLPPWRGAAWSPSGCNLPPTGRDRPPRLALVEAVRQGRPGLEVLPVRYRNTL